MKIKIYFKTNLLKLISCTNSSSQSNFNNSLSKTYSQTNIKIIFKITNQVMKSINRSSIIYQITINKLETFNLAINISKFSNLKISKI